MGGLRRRYPIIATVLVAAIALTSIIVASAWAGDDSATMKRATSGSSATETPVQPADPYADTRTAPARIPVSALDGTELLDERGDPVTVVFGDQMRGVVSDAQARDEWTYVRRMQLADACRRGISVPVEVVTASRPGESEEAFTKRRHDDLMRAIDANGGRATRPAC